MKKKKKAKRTRGRYEPKAPFRIGEVIFFEPKKWQLENYPEHPLIKDRRCYWLGEIPNVPGHCLVFNRVAGVLDMLHVGDFRKAREDEL